MILKMNRVNIYALLEEKQALLKKLQSKSIIEIIKVDDDLKTPETSQQVTSLERKKTVLDSALNVLKEYNTEKKPLFSYREDVSESEVSEAETKIESCMEIAEHVNKINSDITADKSSISKLESDILAMDTWMMVDLPMNYKRTKTTTSFYGRFLKQVSPEEMEQIQNDLPKECNLELLSSSKAQTCYFVTAYNDSLSEAEAVLRKAGFVTASLPEVDKTPNEYVEGLKKEIEAHNKGIEEKKQMLSDLSKESDNLKMCYDTLSLKQEELRATSIIGTTQRTFRITGYVTEAKMDKLEKCLDKFNTYFETVPIAEDENPPVALKNNKLASAVEPITEMYAMPAKTDIDPNAIMAPFYYIFFGMMLSDAAYGILISVVTFILLKKKKMEDSMRKMLTMFFYCGLSTTVWGAIFGGWFGDAANIIAKTFFHKDFAIKPIWFNPVDEPMKMLALSLVLGCIHILVGMGVKFYMQWKSGDKWGAIFDEGSWWILFLGLAFIAGGMFLSVPTLSKIGPYVSILGAAMLVLTQGRHEKGFKKVTKGIISLYDITGFLSDVLSYSRLLALGLATGVIASVVNLMGAMAPWLFPIVFILGHCLNIGINLLGAYVHTSRLQYVEFFGKFYEGGGKTFEPFSGETKYYKLKEEN